jgi:hypothetical protein
MVLRWPPAAFLNAERTLRRPAGDKDQWMLCSALVFNGKFLQRPAVPSLKSK